MLEGAERWVFWVEARGLGEGERSEERGEVYSVKQLQMLCD